MSALAEALVAAQAELPCALGKDADGQIGQRSYKYLTLDKLIAETRPILQKHGLSIVQLPSFELRGEDGAIPTLQTELFHVSGLSLTQSMPLYLSEKTMQGLGAAITYARRYAWQSRARDRSRGRHGRTCARLGRGRAVLAVSKRKVHGAQLEIPTGNEIGRKHDPDAEFARIFGDPAAARERLRFTEERRCTCGSPNPEKWGTRWKHKPPCPRAGRKF